MPPSDHAEPQCDTRVKAGVLPSRVEFSMSSVIKRSASQAVKCGRSQRDAALPQVVRPQLSQPVEKPPSGPQWVHEIKLDGYRMAARVDNGRVQLLTRTGLDWTPNIQASSRRSRT
jgi:ATP-dependent DNA ligase